MNPYLKNLLILCSAIALFSCSDEFVNDKLTISGVATSAIILSPEWEADDYAFKCEGVKSADFTINSQPAWLKLDSKSGQIADSMGIVHGAATAEPRFSKVGIYADQMMITASNKQYAVPVYYITEGNPAVQVNRAFEINYNNYSNLLQISNTGDGILLWDLVSIPDWLTVDMNQFNAETLILAKGMGASLPLMLNVQAATQNNLQGTLVLKTNDKNNPLVEIAVKANLGTPDLHFYNNQLDFGTTETTKTTQIYNQGSGILVWRFEGLPEWLSVSTASGSVMPYNYSNNLTFTINSAILEPGLHTATFFLKSNDPDEASVTITVSVRVPGTGANIKVLEGNILDAAFDKETNTLYFVTGQPNKLVAYDVTSRTMVHEVALTKSPTCLALNTDSAKALVGHGGAISVIDLTTFQVSKTFELNTTVYDVEWGIDDWFCYTNSNSNSYNLLWIQYKTGATYQSPQTPLNYSLGTADLKKVPNQHYLIASKKEVSPSGLFVFDLATRAFKSYAHESIGNVWFTNDGEFMATGTSSIMRTSAVTATSGNLNYGPSSIGKLKTGDYAYTSWWVDHSAASNSIWALFSYYTHSYYPPVKGALYQFEDNDYTLVKTYTYDYMYQPDAQTTAYEVEARYVFANSAGTELSLLRKGASNTTWSIEFITVQ